MNAAVDTLFYAINSKTIHIENKKAIFINAMYGSDLSGLGERELYLCQYFKPYEQKLVKSGFSVHSDLWEAGNDDYDVALILVPKSIIEARYMIAQAICCLSDGGVIACAAENKVGGSRLKKLLQEFGFSDIGQDSRNKARVVWASKGSIDSERVAQAIEDGRPQKILEGKYTSQPGVFGWNKIDVGSRLLVEGLRDGLKRRGADFGCGYGYLSDQLLSNNKNIGQLFCIDADSRAIEACRINLQAYDFCKIEYLWRDLTCIQSDIKDLDFVIMNPPFHEGKVTDTGIGAAFIKSAYASLRKGGELLMVANKQLAYETILDQHFRAVEKLQEQQGFKIFRAVK